MFGTPTGAKGSPSTPFSANTTTVMDGNEKMNNGNTSTINKDDPDWKSKLNLPEVDRRARTSDVTNTSGHDFEDYCLKRELLMGKKQKSVLINKNFLFFLQVFMKKDGKNHLLSRNIQYLLL
jgi:hypothetical protein